MVKRQKAIILLTPPYGKHSNNEFKKELSNVCLENNITITRFIEIRNVNYCRALKRLIKATTLWKKKAGIVILEQSMFNSFTNSVMMSVLGTLSISEAINIYVYEKVYNKNKEYRGIKLYMVLYINLLLCILLPRTLKSNQ